MRDNILEFFVYNSVAALCLALAAKLHRDGANMLPAWCVLIALFFLRIAYTAPKR